MAGQRCHADFCRAATSRMNHFGAGGTTASGAQLPGKQQAALLRGRVVILGYRNLQNAMRCAVLYVAKIDREASSVFARLAWELE